MKTIKLLTIGNSFSGNATKYLCEIAEGTGDVRIDLGRADLGGCSLEKHRNLASYTEKFPEFKTYQITVGEDGNPVKMNLQEALQGDWDVVTLQQVSVKSWQRETFEPWLGDLVDMVRTALPDASLRLHQTWAYRTDTPFYAESNLNQEMMHKRIRANYLHFSQKYGLAVLPSGEAIKRARDARPFVWPDSGFDYQNAEPPALPNEDNSFAAGWQWRIITENGIPALGRDSNHLNDRGCYLCAAVWFEKLTGMSIFESSFSPQELDSDDVDFLKRIAHETVQSA